jgi:hypothetical protein
VNAFSIFRARKKFMLEQKADNTTIEDAEIVEEVKDES